MKSKTMKKQKPATGRDHVDKQPEKQPKQPRGRPFSKGNTAGFKPGQSGNPAGRPKGVRYLSEAYRAWLSQPSEKDPEHTNADMVAEIVGRAALNGDLLAVKEITDRTEGRARQAIDLNGDPEKLSLIERTIATLMEQQNMSRDEAVEYLSTLKPEISQWIN